MRQLHPHAQRGLLIEWAPLGPGHDRGGDLRRDRAAADRPLRAPAVAAAGRAVPPGDLGLPARVGGGAARLAPHRPRRRRVVVGPGLRAAGGARALRDAARVLPRRLRRGARAPRRRGRRERSCRSSCFPTATSSSDPDRRRDRRGRRARRSTPSGRRLRPRDRRRRAGRLSAAVYGASEGLRTLVVDERRDRRPGDLELADPQLPRLPARRQRPPARRAGLRAGVGLRRAASPSCRTVTGLVRDGDRLVARPRRRRARSRARAVLLATGATLPPARRPRARGAAAAPASSTAARRRRRRRWRQRRLRRRRRRTPPGRPRCTSPATRARSRSSCARESLGAGHVALPGAARSRRRRTSRSGSGPRSSAAAATAGCEQLVLRDRRAAATRRSRPTRSSC